MNADIAFEQLETAMDLAGRRGVESLLLAIDAGEVCGHYWRTCLLGHLAGGRQAGALRLAREVALRTGVTSRFVEDLAFDLQWGVREDSRVRGEVVRWLAEHGDVPTLSAARRFRAWVARVASTF